MTNEGNKWAFYSHHRYLPKAIHKYKRLHYFTLTILEIGRINFKQRAYAKEPLLFHNNNGPFKVNLTKIQRKHGGESKKQPAKAVKLMPWHPLPNETAVKLYPGKQNTSQISRNMQH